MPFKTILNNIGGAIKTVTEFVEDEVIDPISNQLEYGVNEFKQGNPAPVLNAMSLGMSGAMAPLTQAVRGVDKTEGTLLESAGNYVEDKTGIPSLVTQVAAGVLIPGPGEYKAAGKSIARGVKKAFPLEGIDNIFPPTPPAALATAGAAPRIQLNVSKGGAVMKAVTLKNPKILKPLGLETGDEIVDAAQAKFNTKRLQKIEQSASKELAAKEAIQNLKDTYGKKPSKAENELVYRMFSRAEGALGRAKEDLSRAQSNVFADKDVYFRSTPSKKAKAVEIINRRTSRKIPNNVSIQIDEHHGFPKGMSAALFDRMDQFIAKGIADPDDLLVMARHAERKGALAGDYKSNMINLVKKPHDELHNYLKNSGDELSKKQWIDVARKAETPDDLLIIFDDLLDRNVIPNLETAKIWQPLSDLIEDIQKAP